VYPLDGARLKFDRGCEHVDTLHDQIPCFLKEHSHRVADQFQPQTGSHDRHIYGKLTPPLWSILLGEIGHNFRSSLDHIAWQLAIVWSPTGDPEDQWDAREISFPIYADRRGYLTRKIRKGKPCPTWRHDGVLPQHRGPLRKLQPYQRRNAAFSHPLWLLHELSNIDKHRVLHTTLVGLGDNFPRPGASFTYTTVDPSRVLSTTDMRFPKG
jgi:hypothetical protein